METNDILVLFLSNAGTCIQIDCSMMPFSIWRDSRSIKEYMWGLTMVSTVDCAEVDSFTVSIQ